MDFGNFELREFSKRVTAVNYTGFWRQESVPSFGAQLHDASGVTFGTKATKE
jgi:hypothetical protein